MTLFVELIQHLERRKLYWVRPLALTTLREFQAHAMQPDFDAEGSESLSAGSSLKRGDGWEFLPFEQVRVYDLRQSADLLWPTNFFRPALDVETVSVIAQLQPSAYPSEHECRVARRQLNHFINTVWAAHESQATSF